MEKRLFEDAYIPNPDIFIKTKINPEGVAENIESLSEIFLFWTDYSNRTIASLIYPKIAIKILDKKGKIENDKEHDLDVLYEKHSLTFP